MTWRDQNGLIYTFSPEDVSRVITDGPYTVTLVAADPMGSLADFISTLVVVVNNELNNRTDIMCQIFGNEDHLLIYKISNYCGNL